MITTLDYPPAELIRRRRALMRAAGAHSIVLVCSARRHHRSNDVEHPYRQNSDFAYLTGLANIDALAVFIPASSSAEYILFYTPTSAAHAVWEGAGYSLSALKKHYHVERIYPREQFAETLPKLLSGKKRLYCSFDQAGSGHKLMDIVRRLRQQRHRKTKLDEILALEKLTHPLRLKKSGHEIRLLQKAVDIAVEAHTNAMQFCRPGLREWDIEAQFIKTLYGHAAVPSYPPIVAAGSNACILHYTNNNAMLRANQLLLVDAGAEHQLYASDITRTYPVNGRFRSHQQELYEVVLAAQLAAIKQVRPGSCWSEVHQAATTTLVHGLRCLGILKGAVHRLLRKKAWLAYYMHGTGHWLGMDVHDAGGYYNGQKEKRFAAGQVLTIEPGLYIPGSSALPAYWRNLGIRIEDDVQLTRQGHRVLSDQLAKDCHAIEALMAD